MDFFDDVLAPSLSKSVKGPASFDMAYAPLASVEVSASRKIGFNIPKINFFNPSFGNFSFIASTNNLDDFGMNLSDEPLPGKRILRNLLAKA